jgi:hypothetical protein
MSNDVLIYNGKKQKQMECSVSMMGSGLYLAPVRNVYDILIGKFEIKKLLGRSKYRRECDVKCSTSLLWLSVLTVNLYSLDFRYKHIYTE